MNSQIEDQIKENERELQRFFKEEKNEDSDEIEPGFTTVSKPTKEPKINKSNRIQFDRDMMLQKYVEVKQIPDVMITKLRDNKVIQLGRHMTSEYSLRPVACDQLPFKVTHLNPFNEAKTKRFQNRQKFYREETEEVIKIPKNLTTEEQIQYLKDFQEKQAKKQQNSGKKQGEGSEPPSPDKQEVSNQDQEKSDQKEKEVQKVEAPSMVDWYLTQPIQNIPQPLTNQLVKQEKTKEPELIQQMGEVIEKSGQNGNLAELKAKMIKYAEEQDKAGDTAFKDIINEAMKAADVQTATEQSQKVVETQEEKVEQEEVPMSKSKKKRNKKKNKQQEQSGSSPNPSPGLKQNQQTSESAANQEADSPDNYDDEPFYDNPLFDGNTDTAEVKNDKQAPDITDRLVKIQDELEEVKKIQKQQELEITQKKEEEEKKAYEQAEIIQAQIIIKNEAKNKAKKQEEKQNEIEAQNKNVKQEQKPKHQKKFENKQKEQKQSYFHDEMCKMNNQDKLLQRNEQEQPQRTSNLNKSNKQKGEKPEAKAGKPKYNMEKQYVVPEEKPKPKPMINDYYQTQDEPAETPVIAGNIDDIMNEQKKEHKAAIKKEQKMQQFEIDKAKRDNNNILASMSQGNKRYNKAEDSFNISQIMDVDQELLKQQKDKKQKKKNDKKIVVEEQQINNNNLKNVSQSQSELNKKVDQETIDRQRILNTQQRDQPAPKQKKKKAKKEQKQEEEVVVEKVEKNDNDDSSDDDTFMLPKKFNKANPKASKKKVKGESNLIGLVNKKDLNQKIKMQNLLNS